MVDSNKAPRQPKLFNYKVAISLTAFALSTCLISVARAADLSSDTIDLTYNFDSYQRDYGAQTVTPTASWSNVEGQFVATISATSLSFSFNSGTWNTGTFNGPTFTVLTSGSTPIEGVKIVQNTMPGLTASDITFTSDSVSINWQGLSFDPSTALLLDFIFPSPPPPPPPPPPLALTQNLVGLAQTSNQRSVATGLTNAFNATNLGTVAAPQGVAGRLVSALNNIDPSAIPGVLNSLSGEAPTGADNAAFQMMNGFLSVMLDPFVDGRGASGFPDGASGTYASNGGALAYADQEQNLAPAQKALMALAVTKGPEPLIYQPHYSAWVAGYGGVGNYSGSASLGSHTVSAAAYGSAAGVDYHVNADTVVGLSLAGAGLQWNLSSGLGNGQGDAIQAGVYGATRFNRFYVAGAFGFANHWINTSRQALTDSLTANFGAQSYGGRIEGGYRLPFTMPIPLPIFQAPIEIVPYAAVQPQVFHTPAYSENDVGGAGFGLNYNSADATNVRTEIGFRADTMTYIGTGPGATKIDLFTRTAWAHDFTNTPSLDAVFQTLPGSNFTVYGARTPHNSALVSDGAQLWLTSSISIIAKFDGELAGDDNIYAGTGTLRYTW